MTESFLAGMAILLRVVSNPLANVFQKQLTNKGFQPLLISFLSYLLLSFLCIIPAMGVSWNQLPSDYWTYSILGGIVGAIGNGLLVKALQTGDLSVLGPINSYKSIIGIIMGFLLLKEVPGWWGLLGVALIIYGSYFVLDTTEDRFTWKLLGRKAIQYRIWAMILTGIEAVFEKKVILASSPLTAFISWCWFGAFFSFFLLFTERKSLGGVKSLFSSGLTKLLYLVLCIGVMQFSTNYVFDHIQVGYALSLFQLSILVSVFLGYRLFKETNLVKKLIGSCIMISGSVLIIVLNK